MMMEEDRYNKTARLSQEVVDWFMMRFTREEPLPPKDTPSSRTIPPEGRDSIMIHFTHVE